MTGFYRTRDEKPMSWGLKRVYLLKRFAFSAKRNKHRIKKREKKK